MPRPARAARAAEDLTQNDLDMIEYRKIPVRRFDEADLHAPVGADMLGSWLLKQMAADSPHLSEAQLFGHLRMALQSNEHFMVRSPAGVVLARLYYEPLDSVPHVKIIGVYTRPEERGDYWALVFAVLEWAKHQGASEVVHYVQSKRTADRLCEALPRTSARESVVTEII